MVTASELSSLTNEGKQAFQSGQYEAAVTAFETAAQGYAELNDEPNAAEMKNNMSVALLNLGRAQAALDAAAGTDQVFAGIGDARRQAMALGNQAAALEDLQRWEEAVATYEQSAALFAETGDGELRSMVMKKAAGMKLRRGQVTDSAFKMLGSLDAKEKPGLFDRMLKSVLHFIQR